MIVTYEQLYKDSVELSQNMPKGIGAIAAPMGNGNIAATIIGSILNIPTFIINPYKECIIPLDGKSKAINGKLLILTDYIKSEHMSIRLKEIIGKYTANQQFMSMYNKDDDLQWKFKQKNINTEKKTIVIHSYNGAVGGIERWAITLIKNLPEFDWRFWIECSNYNNNALIKEVKEYAKVYEEHEWEQAINGASILLAAGPIPFEFDGTVVGIVHGEGHFTRSQMKGLIDADRFVAVSQAASNAMPYYCDVIPNGVDVKRCISTKSRGQVRKEWGVGENEIVVGYLGRLCEDKGIKEIVDAVSRLGSQFSFVCVGEGGFRKTLKRYCDKVGVKAYFPGVMRDVGNAYTAFDCCVVLSKNEGFCLVAAESMASGCPLVVNKVGIIPQILKKNGRVVYFVKNREDSLQVAKQIRDAVVDKEDIRHKAQKIILNEYTDVISARKWKVFIDGIKT